MHQVSKVVIFSLLVAIISACSPTIESEQEATIEAVESAFTTDEKKEANNETDNAKFYLPSKATIKEAKNNNIIFEKDSKVYILFSNPNEDEKSDVVYNSTMSDEVEYIINDTFEMDGKFSFLLVHEISEDTYELTVGVGGIKATTVTDLKKLSADAELMAEIVSTYEYK